MILLGTGWPVAPDPWIPSLTQARIRTMLSIRETARDPIDPIVLRVQSRAHGRVRDLRVERNGEQVILRGRVATYHTKQLAQHGALDAPIDLRLVNKIVVG
jgi:hypothetical protein